MRSRDVGRGKAVLTIALAMSGLACETRAQGLSSESLMGRWCTEAGAYVFTPTTLMVIRIDGSRTTYHIALITIRAPDIVVYWQDSGHVASDANHGKGNKTTFSHFTNDRMDQLPTKLDDGSKSRGRAFHRC